MVQHFMCAVWVRGLKLKVTCGPHETQSKFSQATLKRKVKNLNFVLKLNVFENTLIFL